MTSINQALVLTGGGARGAYQAGVLKYIGENISRAHFNTLIGSSSGAINVAGLASAGGELAVGGPEVARLWSHLEMHQVFRTDFLSLAKIASQWMYSIMLGGLFGKSNASSLVDTAPLGQLLERIYRPEVVREALRSGRLRSVAVSATEVNTGSLVTFVQALEARSWQRARRRSIHTELNTQHVMASAAIPLLFPGILLNNRQYVDGCIRSTNPLGPALRLGAQKILAIGVRRYYMRELGNHFDAVPPRPEPRPTPAQLGALVLNSLFAEALDADVEHLERLNSILPKLQESSFGMRQVEVMVIRPSEDLGEIATHFRRKAPSMVRFLLRGLGSESNGPSDILSYLLFVPEYLQTLVDLGYQDAQTEDARLRHFLEV